MRLTIVKVRMLIINDTLIIKKTKNRPSFLSDFFCFDLAQDVMLNGLVVLF